MSINTALYNGLSGLNSYGTALSVVSDNVSNANTTAFKSNSVRFGDMVNSYYATLTNDTEREGAGVSVMGFASDFGQGNIVDTSNWSDVAVSGSGYFAVEDSSGRAHYSRDGSFRLAGDEQTGVATTETVDGVDIQSTPMYDYLVNQQGYYVLDDQGNRITVQIRTDRSNITDPLIPVEMTSTVFSNYRVDGDGTIYGVNSGTGEEEAITNLAGEDFKLGLTVFSNENGLIREGSNLYTAGVDSGTATRNGDAGASPALYGNILDNSLEGSNVDLSKEMVDMIIYQAGFNANSKTITTSSSLLDTTIAMVR